MVELQIFPETCLRETCSPVENFDEALHLLLNQMKAIMYAEKGIGLAANQVGITQNIFLADVSPMFKDEHIEDYGPPTEWDRKYIEFINPKITHKEGLITWNEGCLSLPTIFYDVDRAKHITIRAQDRTGSPFEVDASNILSVCCQHEYDHLFGNIFLDYVSPMKRKTALSKLKKIKKARQDK